MLITENIQIFKFLKFFSIQLPRTLDCNNYKECVIIKEQLL